MTTSDSASDSVELAAAFQRFGGLLDPDAINARQPMGPATVYTPWVIIWLLVYQRLHANASLADAVAQLLRSTDLLPPNRRINEHTLSTNTGAYSRARSRLRTDVPETVADHVFDTLVAATPPSFGRRRAFVVDGTTITLTPHRRTPRRVPAGHQRFESQRLADLALGRGARTGQRLRDPPRDGSDVRSQCG